MNVWICPPVAAVDSVTQTSRVTVSCTRQAARCWGVGFTWHLARLSAACLLAACVGQSQRLQPVLLSLSLSHTLGRTLWPHTHTLSWSHSVPLTLHIYTHNLVICFLFSVFLFLLSCAHKSSKSSIPRRAVTTFSFLADILYICGMVCVCVVTPFPHCIPLFHRILCLRFPCQIPKPNLGNRTKPRLLSHWLEQSTADTAAGFGPYRLQGEWLERTGKSRWSSLASVFLPVCLCVCVCVCVCVSVSQGSH